jgi:hypothetical protein
MNSVGKALWKNNMNRQKWLKSLKRGDKVWIVPFQFYCVSRLTWKQTFGGWFDLKGSNGEDCLLDYGGLLQFPASNIFPTKREAQIFAAPLKIKFIKKRMNSLNKESQKLYKEWSKLEKILEKHD